MRPFAQISNYVGFTLFISCMAGREAIARAGGGGFGGGGGGFSSGGFNSNNYGSSRSSARHSDADSEVIFFVIGAVVLVFLVAAVKHYLALSRIREQHKLVTESLVNLAKDDASWDRGLLDTYVKAYFIQSQVLWSKCNLRALKKHLHPSLVPSPYMWCPWDVSAFIADAASERLRLLAPANSAIA